MNKEIMPSYSNLISQSSLSKSENRKPIENGDTNNNPSTQESVH